MGHRDTRRWVVHPMPDMSGQLVHHLQYSRVACILIVALRPYIMTVLLTVMI